MFNHKVRPTVGGAPFSDDNSCWSHARTQWATIIADLHGSIWELLLGDWWCDRTMWKTRCSGNKCDCRTARSKLDFFFFPPLESFSSYFFSNFTWWRHDRNHTKRLRRHWIWLRVYTVFECILAASVVLVVHISNCWGLRLKEEVLLQASTSSAEGLLLLPIL